MATELTNLPPPPPAGSQRDRASRLVRRHWMVGVGVVLGLIVGIAAGGTGGSTEVQGLHERIASLESQIASLDSQITSLTSDNASLTDDNQELNGQVTGLEQVRWDLEQQKADLEAQLNATGPLPALVGMSRDDVEGMAQDYGWTVSVTEKESPKAPGTVLSQSPKAGTLMRLAKGFTIVIAKPLPPKMPNLAGKTQQDAKDVAAQHGWTFTVTKEESSQEAGTIIRQTPAPGTYMRGAAKFTIVIAKPAPPPPSQQPPPSNCTAGYSPCLPPASDYDCYGGSGNGPEYTEPGVVYQVTGSDPYGLDSDNDGLGCE